MTENVTPRKNYPAKNCGVHCNLTHDKTYFSFSFFGCLYLCTGLMTTESPGSLALAAEDEVLVFVSIPAGNCCLSLIIFLLADVEHAMIMELINKTLINSFPMTSRL